MRFLLRAVVLLGLVASCNCGSQGSGTPASPVTSASASGAAHAPSLVDPLLRDLWAKRGLTPAPAADDATFLRRLYVDVLGTVPQPDEVRVYLADAKPNKRARIVDAVLADPRHVKRLVDYWEDVLLRKEEEKRVVDRAELVGWLEAKLRAKTPWDQVARELVTASGRNRGDEDDVNGAVNWLLQFQRNPQDAAGAAARTFLGAQIQCAQCHDHKTEPLKQSDFLAFAAGFARVNGKADGGDPRRVELVIRDVDHPVYGGPKAMGLKEVADLPPKTLDGTPLPLGRERRAALASWLTSPRNPSFSRAFVNRMWALLLGRGFVEPVDDLRPTNPAEAPELLDALARDFVASGHDGEHLLRVILTSEAYARGAEAVPDAEREKREAVWASYPLKPMPPEVLFNVFVDASGIEPAVRAVLGDELPRVRENMRRAFDVTFSVEEDDGGASYAGTIAQALLLQNGRLANGAALALPESRVAKIIRLPSDAAKIDEAYLATFSRFPTDTERTRWLAYLAERDAGPRAPGAGRLRAGGGAGALVSEAESAKDQALEDLFWALLNASEMTFNH
jgi:hypothetical protein